MKSPIVALELRERRKACAIWPQVFGIGFSPMRSPSI